MGSIHIKIIKWILITQILKANNINVLNGILHCKKGFFCTLQNHQRETTGDSIATYSDIKEST
jgi:hypothetical protein